MGNPKKWQEYRKLKSRLALFLPPLTIARHSRFLCILWSRRCRHFAPTWAQLVKIRPKMVPYLSVYLLQLGRTSIHLNSASILRFLILFHFLFVTIIPSTAFR